MWDTMPVREEGSCESDSKLLGHLGRPERGFSSYASKCRSLEEGNKSRSLSARMHEVLSFALLFPTGQHAVGKGGDINRRSKLAKVARALPQLILATLTTMAPSVRSKTIVNQC